MRIGIVGCGLIGQRRANIIAQDPPHALVAVSDVNPELALRVAAQFSCRAEIEWQHIVSDKSIDAVIISTPNAWLAPIGCAALRAGKHVLIEKPMGKNLPDAVRLQSAAAKSRKKLKIGFNHRYHPALLKAFQLFREGTIGKIINMRAVYGHGGRKGYEKEWRGNPKLAGGGELTDQGVHIIDLMQWFAGPAEKVTGMTQTAFWPIAPSEDNGFALLQFKGGALASFHTSWTQWKNQFTFDIFGSKGSLSIQGLGGSYGVETLTVALRKKEGGAPDMTTETFTQPDDSWRLEWEDFKRGITGKSYYGNPQEGVAVMRTLNALYRASKNGKRVTV